MHLVSSHGSSPVAHVLFADMLWCLSPNTTLLQRTQVLTQPDRETTLHDLLILTLRVPVPKTEHTLMVSFILFSLVGARGTGPRLVVLLDHLLGTTVRTRTLLRRVGQAALGIICPAVGMKILINVKLGCSYSQFSV